MLKVLMRCLGCGGNVCYMKPGQAMAIACRCGAGAPILYSDTGSVAPPASLVFLSQAKVPPHIEYYLGYSDHESEAKDVVIDLLVRQGATWQRDCPEEECQRAIERRKQDAERRREALAAYGGSDPED